MANFTRRIIIAGLIALQLAGLTLYEQAGYSSLANVSVTAATNGTNLTGSWTTLTNIVITEGASADYVGSQTNTTLILTVPSAYEFRSGFGSCAISGPDITAASITSWTATGVTVTITTNGGGNGLTDQITISGLQIRVSGAGLVSCSNNAGNIYRVVGNPGNAVLTGITNGVTNFGTLTSSYSAPPANNVSVTWGPVGTGMDACGVVSSAVYNGELYVGGCFNNAGGTSANMIAKWNGTSWSAVGNPNTFDQSVEALEVYNGELYAGGIFNSPSSGWGGTGLYDFIAKWNGTTWSAVGGSGPNGPVQSLAVYNSKLYVGGAGFTVPASGIASWDGTSWAALGSGVNGNVDALCVYGTDLYAGGSFGVIPLGGIYYIAKWNGTSWSNVGTNNPLMNFVKSLAVYNSELYAGGQFSVAGSGPANYIAKWNGSAWSSVGNGTNNFVEALYVYNSDLYVGGWFTQANCNPASRIAKWDGTNWWSLGAGLNNWVFTIAAYNAEIYAGGFFWNSPGPDVNYIAKFAAGLPVELISFTGKNHKGVNILEWTTASETHNDHFTIERSMDGIEFTSVGHVKSPGNSTSLRNYEFTDDLLLTTYDYYYRLKQTDLDGNYSYSETILVQVPVHSLPDGIQAWYGDHTLEYSFYSPESSAVRLSVKDVHGNQAAQAEAPAVKGANSGKLYLGSLSKGIYFLRVDNGTHPAYARFVVQ